MEGASRKCELCKCDVTIEESLSLQNCSHMFHSECLQEYIEVEMETGNVTFKCPASDCAGSVGPVLIQFNFPQEYEAYIELCARNINVQPTARLFCCRTLGCPFVAVVDRQLTEMHCTLCGEMYCLECMGKAHHPQTCSEFFDQLQSDTNLQLWLQKQDPSFVRLCPICQFIIRRMKFCKFVQCPSPACKRKTNLCMACGKVLTRYEEPHECVVSGLDMRKNEVPLAAVKK